nr:hypothetical protein [uncultured Roseateles sp.]
MTQTSAPAVRLERPTETYADTARSAGRAGSGNGSGGGGLADAMERTFQQLGLSSGSDSASQAEDSASSQRKTDLGRLMQALFQAVHAHSPPLTTGESSSFAAALASLTSQMSSGDSVSSLQAALGRVLQDLQSSQHGSANPLPSAQDLLNTLQRNLDQQTNVVQTKGNVLNERA